MASPSLVLQRFPYAFFNAVVTKISKWSRIQDSCRITPKIESLVAYAMPDIPSKFQKDPSITFRVILVTQRQTNKNRQKHYLLGGGKYVTMTSRPIQLISKVCVAAVMQRWSTGTACAHILILMMFTLIWVRAREAKISWHFRSGNESRPTTSPSFPGANVSWNESSREPKSQSPSPKPSSQFRMYARSVRTGRVYG